MKTVFAQLVLLAATSLLAADLPVWQAESLGTPRRTSRMNSPAVSVNAAGQPVFIAQFMNYKNTTGRAIERVDLPTGEHYVRYVDTDSRPDGEWVVANLATGAVKLVEFPGFHSTTSCRAPNGRVFFNLDFGHILYYDPADDTLHMLGQLSDWVPYSNDRLFWKMQLGPDGFIYASTQAYNHKTSMLRLNPDTLEYKVFHDVGTGERSETLTYGYWFQVDPPWVYVAVGQGQWELWGVNVETGDKVLLGRRYAKGAMISVNVNPAGVVATLSSESDMGLDLEDKDSRRIANVLHTRTAQIAYYWCVDGKLVPDDHSPGATSLPFVPMSQRPPPPFAWQQTRPLDNPAWPEIDTPRIVIDENGAGTIPWRPAGETGAWRPVPFRIQRAEPVPIESLTALADGSVFGSCEQYRGTFRYLPGEAALVRLRPLGSRPAMAEAGGLLYTASYPNCVFHAVDFAQPWTTGDTLTAATNPRQIDYFSRVTNSHHSVRLTAAANGRLYLLGQRERRATGSGVGWYEPASGKFGGLMEALSDRNPRGLAILSEPPCVVVSGQLLGEAAEGQSADLVVYDLDLREQGRHVVREGWRDTGAIFPGREPGRVIGIVRQEESTIGYEYDLVAGKVVAEQTWQPALGAVFARGAELWALQGSQLCRLEPGLALTPVAELGETGLRLPVWAGEALYAARGAELVRFSAP